MSDFALRADLKETMFGLFNVHVNVNVPKMFSAFETYKYVLHEEKPSTKS